MKKLLKKENFVYSVLLILIISLFFGNVFFFGKTLVPSQILPGAYPNGTYGYNGGGLTEYPVKDPGAFAWHHEPAVELNSQSYSLKEIPLWNPYNAAGEPQAADGQSSAFFPLILPLFVNPSPIMWDLFMLFRLFVAGLFTFLFARKLKISKSGSVLASLTFTFSGYFIAYISMMHLNVEVLIPAALFFAEKLFQKTNIKNSIYLSLVLGLAVLAGMPESTFLLFAFTLLYFTFRMLYPVYKELRDYYQLRETPSGEGMSPIKLKSAVTSLIKKNYSSLKKPAAFVLLSVVLAVALSSILILPFMEYLKLSWNNHPATKGLAGMPVESAVSLIVPRFLGTIGSWNKGNRHQVLGYVGVIPLILAFCINKKRSFAYFFAGFSILFLLKSFGFPVINWLGYLPLLRVVTFPKYASPFFALSIGLLAGHALDSVKSISFKRFFAIYGAWVLLVLFFISYYWKDMTFFHYRTFVFSKILWSCFFAVILAGLVVSIKKGWLKENLTKTAIVIMVGLELFSYIPKQRNTRHYSYLKPPYVKFLQEDNSTYRVTGMDKVLYPNTNIGFGLFDYRSLNALHINRYMDLVRLFSDRRMLGHVTGDENIDWSNQLIDILNIKYVLTTGDLNNRLVKTMIENTKPPLKEEVLKTTSEEAAVFSKSGSYRFLLRAPLATKGLSFAVSSGLKTNDLKKGMLIIESGKDKKIIHAGKKWQKLYFNLSPGKDKIVTFNFKAELSKGAKILVKDMQFDSWPSRMDRYELIYKKDIDIFKNNGALPRAFIAYDALNMGNKSKVFKALRNNKTDLSRTVLLEEPLKGKIGPRPPSSGKAKISDLKNNSVKVEAQTDENGLLFLSDAYFPGWKAYLDGKPTDIYIADYLFRAVYLPKGRHTVVFQYEPFSFLLGSIISGLTLLAVALLLGGLFIKSKVESRK